MSRIRSLRAMYGILLVALGSLAVAACGGDESTGAATSKAQTRAARSGDASSTTLSIGTGVHVTNTPTKAFRVKPVDTTRSVALGPSGYPVYTFQDETTDHVICQKTAG